MSFITTHSRKTAWHPRILLTLAACIVGSTPAAADFISTNILVTPTGGPGQTQSSGVAGQVITLNATPGPSFAQAVTDYGANHAQTSGATAQNFAQATSDWQIGFDLAGNGLPANSFVSLTISYSYDFTLTAFAGFGSGYGVAAGYCLTGNNASQGNGCDVFRVTATSTSDGSLEDCRTRFPSGGAPPQACLGSYGASGTVTPLMNFHTGANILEGSINASSGLGAVDAYNSGLITGILVPDGITWTYGPGVTGNPLNFHYASASVPEPGTFGILGLGLGVFGLLRLRRRCV